MIVPRWFSSINWSQPVTWEELRVQRHLLPPHSGVYAFTIYDGPLSHGTGNLYVGKASSLHQRVQTYLSSPEELPIFSKKRKGQLSASLRHPGKAMILVEVQQRVRALGYGNSGIWVRWALCAAPLTLEDQLIKYLQPAFNTQGLP